uniref:Bm1494 n=1 Tax=Brugia malayi TaxID=6279 RepID=A0A1I9G270_BRUMA|nr:Bm1494 [Brugia malayi]
MCHHPIHRLILTKQFLHISFHITLRESYHHAYNAQKLNKAYKLKKTQRMDENPRSTF